MNRIKIVYMGTPQFAVPPLERLISEGYEICAVVTAPDKPVGRGLKVSQSEVKKYALSLGLKVLQPHSLKDEMFVKELSDINAHLFIVVAFRMLPKIVWSLPSIGTFNLHASLLPQYRGAAPINHVLINGETTTGVTTFMIDEEIDTGKILLQSECNIGENENAGELHDKLSALGASLVLQSVKKLIKGEITPIDQNRLIENGTSLKVAPKLTRESGKIDWKYRSYEVFNLIRGLSPYPAAYSNFIKGDESTMLKIYSAEYDNLPTRLKPGETESDGKSYLKVGCKEGSVYLISVQAAGKKRLGIREFLPGIRDIEKWRFE